MKGRYLIIAAILLTCVFIALQPQSSGANTQGPVPSSYTDLEPKVELSPSDSMDWEGDTITARVSNTNVASYMGKYSYEGQTDLFLWLHSPMASGNVVTLQYRDKTYEFETVNFLGSGDHTTILKLEYNTYQNVLEMYLCQSGIHFESSDEMRVYVNDYRVWTDDECSVDVSAVSDGSAWSTTFNGTFSGSLGGIGSLDTFPILSSEVPADFSWNGYSLVSNLNNGAITVRPADTSVGKAITFQTDDANDGFFITGGTSAMPVELRYITPQDVMTVTATYDDGIDTPYEIDYMTVQGKILRMDFNPSDFSTVQYSDSNELKGVSISTDGHALDVAYKENTYSKDTSADVTFETSSGSDMFLRLTSGAVTLSGNSAINAGFTEVRSDGSEIAVSGSDRSYTISAADGEQFLIEGFAYTAVGNSTYALFRPDINANREIHGIQLAENQSVCIGNSALAYLNLGDNSSPVYVGVRNDTAYGSAETVLTVNNANSTVSSESGVICLGTYSFNNASSTLAGLENYVLSGDVTGTVNSNGVFTKTGGSGTVTSTVTVEIGGTLALGNGTTFTATRRSVFTGSTGSYVMMSGEGSLESDAASSITITCPDGNVRTITGASTVSMGATIGFTASAGSSIVFPDIATYTVGENATLILDANNMITMTVGRVTVPEGDSIIISGATFTAVGTSGDIQYLLGSLNVYIFAGKFSVASSQPITIENITFEAAETGILLGTSSYNYVDSAITVGIRSGSVLLKSVEPRISFTGTISIKNHEYTSVSAQAVMYCDQNNAFLSSGTVSPGAGASVKLESGLLISGSSITVTDGGMVTVGVGGYVNVSLDTQEFAYTHHPSIDSSVILSFAVSQGNLIANLLSGTIWLRGDGGGANSVLVNNLQYSAESGAFITYGTYPELVSGTAVIEAGAALKIGTSQFTATDTEATLTADNGVATLDSGKVTIDQGSSVNSAGTVFSAVGGAAVISRSGANTELISGTVSLTSDTQTSIVFSGYTIIGASAVSKTDGTVTVPASGTVTFTPVDGGESSVYENASSVSEMVFSNTTGVFRIASGAYKLHAGGTVTIGGYDVTFVSQDEDAFTAVGAGSITASNAQTFNFVTTDSGDTYTFTAAADGTVFSISTGIEVTAGAVAIGGENYEQVTIRTQAGSTWYESSTGAVISVGDEWGELVSGTALVDDGSRLVVSGIDYLAGDGGATITLSGTDAVLTGGCIVLEDGYHIKAGDVTVTNSSGPDISLYSTMTAEMAQGSTISTRYGSQPYTYTAVSATTVNIAADGRISVTSGNITLNQGESVTVGDVTLTATVDSTTLSVADGVATLQTGAVTLSASGTIILGGTRVTGPISASVSDTLTVTVAGGGTVSFTTTTIYSYTNASDSVPLVLTANSEGGTFSPQSGSYYVYYRSPVSVNGVTVSVGGQEGDHITVDTGSSTVTMANGQTVTFGNSVSYTAASDGTSFTVNTLNNLPMVSGSVTLSERQQVLIGSTAYTARSDQTVISSVGGTGVLTSGSVSFPAGSSLTVGSAAYTAVNTAATVSVSNGIATLESGTVTLVGGVSVDLGDVTVLNNGTVPFDVPAGGAITLPQGAKIRTTLGSTSYDFTAASQTEVRVESDGTISIISTDSLSLAQGESVTIGNTVITADTASEISVSDEAFTLVSGTVSLSTVSAGSTSVRISGIEVLGASSASVGTTAYVVGPAGGTLTINSETYQNASQTQTINFTYESGAFVLSEGSYLTGVSGDESVTVNGFTIKSGSDTERLELTVGTDTVGANGTVPVRIVKNNVEWTYGSPTNAVFTFGTNAVLTSGSVAVPDGISLMIGDAEYHAEGDDTVLSAESGKAVLVSGSVIVPDNASVTVLGTEFTAFDGSGIISAVSSPSGDYVSLIQSGFGIVSAPSLSVSLSESGTLLKVGDSTYAYTDTAVSLGIAGTVVTLNSVEPWVTFNGAIIIGGVTYQSDGEASICYNGTLCELGSGMISFAGTSSSPVSLRIMTYSVSTESAVKIGLEEIQSETVITLHSGSVTADSDIPLTVSGTAFNVGSGVTVTSSQTFTIPEQKSISFTVSETAITIACNGPEDLTYTHADSLLAMPAGCEVQLTIGSTAPVTYGVTAVSEAAVAVGTDVQELRSGNIQLPRGQSVRIGSGLYSMQEESVLGIESGTAVLLDGAVSIQGSAALKAGGTLFTAGSEGASMAYSDQTVPRITEGSVTALGTFEISSEVVSYSFDGSGAYTVAVDPTDKSVSLTTSNDGTGGTMIKIMSGQEFMVLQEVSSATLNVKDVSATVAAPPTAKLLAGSAVLGENASVTVPAHGGGADKYILFYGGTPGEVRVEHQSLNSPIVTLKSGSISLDDGVDPTYTNTGTGEAAFVALGSNELSLKEGTITVPVGSTVHVGDKTVTAVNGDVTINSAGDVTLGAGAKVSIADPFGSQYELENKSSEPMTQNVDQYVESHAFTGFNERREVCISSVQEMYRTGQSQKVRALIDSTVEKLRSAVYDSSISYEENLRMLDHMVMGLEEQIRGMFDPEQAFQDYKESIIEELEALHVGETSLSEQRIIDNAISSISSMSYNDQTYDSDMAAITEALAAVEKNLSGYRSSGSAAFIVLREILKDYVKTEPVDGFEAITSLKQQYTSALEDIQYLNNLSSDANLQRLNDLRDAFDGAVYSIHVTEYQKVRNSVLAEMNALYQSYPSPVAKDLIDSAIAKVNLRAYDAQRVYTDNVNILSNLLANLKTNLSSTLLGNIETFNAYCDSFLERYTEAFAAYTEARETAEPAQQVIIDDILGWIQEAKDKVDPTVEGHITYDTTKSLNDNINAVFAIAKNLEDDINNHINAQISNELDRVYNAARAHLNLNDREGVPTKLRDYISTTRTNLETEYNSEHSAMDKGLNINVIMTTYNTEMAVLIEQAEFYLNVDVGVKYLQDRYATSYAAVVSLMNTDIALLRALEYDTSKEMSQNLSELQERINNYSVALATLRKNTTQGDFENYREFRAWTVTEYLSENSTQAEKDLANQYAASIRAVVFNGKSIESNRYAVDRLFSEFESKYLALMADQRKGDFDALRNTLRSDIDAALLDGDRDSVRAAAERGKTWIGEFVFDRSADYDTNSANITLIKDATLLAIEYERSTDAAVKAAKVAQANSDILDLPGLIAAINAQSAVDDSQKIRTILENARAAVSGISYDFSQSPRDNLASAEAVMARFSQDLYEQRLMENSTTVGGIRADGKTIDGKTAEYPKDSDEIWGIVANATGLGDDASATISRVTPTLDPAAGTTFPASGSVANVLSNGKVLGAFDVTLYNGGERVTSFSGMYCIKILLPEDMRGFDSVQVAYVDEFGDVQIYDARVEGNYLVFETAHFSTFNVYGNITLHTHYDIYLYVVLIVLAVLLLVFLIRVVRYDANGGQGSTPATVFFCDGEGSLPENGFTREGYTFGGWSRKADGSDPISADAELSALGKIHFLKLYAVWNKEEVQQ